MKNEALSSLWARGRIEELLRDPGVPIPDSIKAAVTALALTHRLMSPYTSFVAVDDSRVVNTSGNARTVRQALPLPEGVSFEGIYGAAKSEDKKDGGVMGKLRVATAARNASPPAGQVDQHDASPDDGERLLDTAFRVLADLADDGTLSAAEGKPALAALLAAQRATGAIADDVETHAVATWALAEAAIAAPGDASIANARTKSVGYLLGLAQTDGWPARPGGAIDAEATRWARLILGSIRPASVGSISAPKGEPGKRYAQLRAALAAAKSGGVPPAVTGRSPFDRLVSAIGRGHLKVVNG